MKHPKFHEAHLGSFFLQSQQYLFSGAAIRPLRIAVCRSFVALSLLAVRVDMRVLNGNFRSTVPLDALIAAECSIIVNEMNA